MYFVCINVVFESIETFYGFFEKILAFIRYAAIMAIPVVEFLREGYKKGFWLKINCFQMKSLNFANWLNGE